MFTRGNRRVGPMSSGRWASLSCMSEFLPEPPVEEQRPAQPYLGIRMTVTMATIPQLADRFPELFGWLAAHGVEPAGPPFFRYHVIDMEHELDMEAGVPVATPVEGDAVVSAGELPAGRYLTASYTGHPRELVSVTRDFLFWARDHGLTFDRWDTPAGDAWRSRLEFMLTDPAVEPDMAKWTTQLVFKLAD